MSQPAHIRPHDVVDSTVAISDAMGTFLPRTGLFWGVCAPKHRPTVVVGDYSTPGADETFIRRWYEPQAYLAEPTSLANTQTGLSKLADFKVHPDDYQASDPVGEAGTQTAVFISSIFYTGARSAQIRNFGAAYAFIFDSSPLTQSLSLKIRDILEPLHFVSPIPSWVERAVDHASSVADRHVGLTSIAWLIGILGVSRPTVLRMAGVPESTFYSWQKNPSSAVRMQSVTRLLRLQARLGVLAHVLGEEAMRNWTFSSNHLESLQGDEDTFERTLAQAEEVTSRTINIRPARRMRPEDYIARQDQPVRETAGQLPVWPGAAKSDEEQSD